MGASEEDQNPSLRRYKAFILFNLANFTQKSRTKQLLQNFEQISDSSSQSRCFIKEIYGDRFAPSQMIKSIVKTANTWLKIYVLNKMTNKLLPKPRRPIRGTRDRVDPGADARSMVEQDSQTSDVDEKILTILS